MPLDPAVAKALYRVHLTVTEVDSGRGALETELVLSGAELGDPTSFSAVVDNLAAGIYRGPAIPFAGA